MSLGLRGNGSILIIIGPWGALDGLAMLSNNVPDPARTPRISLPQDSRLWRQSHCYIFYITSAYDAARLHLQQQQRQSSKLLIKGLQYDILYIKIQAPSRRENAIEICVLNTRKITLYVYMEGHIEDYPHVSMQKYTSRKVGLDRAWEVKISGGKAAI
ncbi:hypothetical protein PHLGIDRAFT_12272 [Phlebiopsis gigantea 11061_1 CR5-6]|uniref:Uncharacterized protein n=1 Tax=Phlebiopsis gigantea (strain 11061_1 CR5-6) TaxID=745531 RepID=A0A0C3PPM5_PHLG1|nr:hypothetical protein PHLGIDRAFT_12272 [Phlebiopsis gigantea 11061_1 CR5-6]